MKKLTAALVIGAVACLLVLPRPSMAGVQFGVKVGGNLARITGPDFDGAPLKDRIGVVGGVFLAFNLGPFITIQPEVLYTMKGVRMEETVGDVTFSEKIYGDYIEIPLLLKLRIPTGSISPVVFAGPAVGFKLSEKFEMNGESVPDTTLLKDNDYGAIFGAGLDFGRHLMLDVRYSMGLQKVFKVIEGETPIDVKNGVWSASVGIAF